MSKTFEPRLDILQRAQRRLWPELGATPSYFTLYGGTALALRLAHRHSADFDFFARKPFKGQALIDKVAYLRGAKIRQSEPNTLTCSVEGSVLVSFFGALSLGQVEPSETAADVRINVASLRDIAGTKAAVVTQRAESKDYLDIHALMTSAKLPLAEMLSCGRIIYGDAFDPFLSLKALAYHDDDALRAVPAAIKRDLVAAVRATDPNKLPRIRALRQRPRAR